jgi:hypothetical protein
MDYFNQEPVVHSWSYGLDGAKWYDSKHEIDVLVHGRQARLGCADSLEGGQPATGHVSRSDLLGVPYLFRGKDDVKSTEPMRSLVPTGQQFYQTYFQTPDVAEKEYESDPNARSAWSFARCPARFPKNTKCPPSSGSIKKRWTA